MPERTLSAIQNITYPHTAWCCDEAEDENIKQLCLQLGVNHVTRTNKKDAKAGNINNALQYATGELCVVLDPDHVPVPEFLNKVIAYFDDPAIGFVQVVQAYYNQQQSLVAKGAAQQTYQSIHSNVLNELKQGRGRCVLRGKISFKKRNVLYLCTKPLKGRCLEESKSKRPLPLHKAIERGRCLEESKSRSARQIFVF